ncbi:MAG: hypothetical protein H6722_29030 [Sandaracinus sp.]|jgi:hypothetical protein|nr:hypothetical protein [Sandaracinus sp.]MCB9616498.1 hypothetical protein [Sandaracinus sp.]MCB9621068.1 hypothetical protein [Sandaracinus sp.]
MHARRFRWLFVLVAACGDDDTSRVDAGFDANVAVDASLFDADVFVDASSDADLDGGVDAGMPCRELPAEDRTRYVVVSHPFATDRTTYAVHALSTAGELTDTGTTFSMGRAFDGEIAFSRDGFFGVVAQDDGTLGVFTIDAAGAVTVREIGRDGDAYAARVIADPNDARVFWVLDSQVRTNGGGVYRVELTCEGRVASETLALAAELPYGLVFEDDGMALLVAKAVGDEARGDDDVFRVNLATGAVESRVDVIEGDDWIGAGLALTTEHLVFADNSEFADVTNRLGVARTTRPLAALAEVADVEDAVALVFSPFGDRLLAVSGYGDALFALTYDAEAAGPVGAPTPLTYVGGRPQLPGGTVAITRGALRGLVLVAENQAIRRVRFEEGAVTDLGATSLGEGSDVIPGAIGVQP